MRRFAVALLAAGALAACPSNSTGPAICGPDTCSGCCDGLGVCQEGSDAGACGTAGGSCLICDARREACVSGACVITVDSGVFDAGLPDAGTPDAGAADGGDAG